MRVGFGATAEARVVVRLGLRVGGWGRGRVRVGFEWRSGWDLGYMDLGHITCLL